jgi:hypothetical protein
LKTYGFCDVGVDNEHSVQVFVAINKATVAIHLKQSTFGAFDFIAVGQIVGHGLLSFVVKMKE